MINQTNKLEKDITHYYFSNPAKSKELSLELIDIANFSNNRELLYKGYLNLGTSYFFGGEFMEGIKYLNMAVSGMTDMKNFTYISYAYAALGLCHQFLNNFTMAIDYYISGLNFLEFAENECVKITIHTCIGSLYSYAGDDDKAITYYEYSNDLDSCNNCSYSRGLPLIRLGNIYIINKKYKKAVSTLNEAINSISNSPVTYNLGLAYSYLGYALFLSGDTELAAEAFKTSLTLTKKFKFYLYHHSISTNYARFLIATENYKQAEKVLKNLYELNLKQDSIEDIIDTCRSEIQLYRISDNKKKLLESYKKYHMHSKELKYRSNEYSGKSIDSKLLLEQLGKTNDVLKTLSETDALTQFPNKYSLNNYFDKAFTECQQNNEPISLIIFNINRFKQYNIIYGDSLGDACIRKVASVIRNSLTDSNYFAGRFGGVEFFIIIKRHSKSDIERYVYDLSKAVDLLNIEHREDPSGHISVSMGYHTCIPSKNNTTLDLIKKADKALNENKL